MNMIIQYLEKNSPAKTNDISEWIGLSARRTREILKQMMEDKIIIAQGQNRNRVYRLK